MNFTSCLIAATEAAEMTESRKMQLILTSLLGVSILLVLVMKFKLHAFVSLILVSLAVGIGAGMPLGDVVGTIEKGMGNTLKGLAIIIGLGSMFGKMLEVSGGAERLAKYILDKMGDEKALRSTLVRHVQGQALRTNQQVAAPY